MQKRLRLRQIPLWVLFPLAGLWAFGAGSAVWYDDGCHYLVVHTLATQGQEAFPVHPSAGIYDKQSLFITVGPAANYPTAAFMQIAGTGVSATRGAAGLFSVLALVMLYVLAGQLFRQQHAGKWAVLVLAVNVQFLTYGSQYLGEPFLLGWLLLGLWAAVRWLKQPHWSWALLAFVGMQGAILSKEYIALPLGMAMLGVLARLFLLKDHRRWTWLGLCVLLPLGAVVYYVLRFDSLAQLSAYWQLKSNYGEEFWIWEWQTAARFLLTKPLVVLGTVALVVRVSIRRSLPDAFLLGLQLWLLAGFLASAAFDRFGLVLLPIPALYVGEWLAAIRARWITHPYAQRRQWVEVGFLLAFGLLFVQRTPLMLYKHYTDQTSAQTVACLQEKLPANQAYFTYDLQMVPHLMDRPWRLPVYPPCAWEHERPYTPMPQEWLLYGDYARTEYELHPTPPPLVRCHAYSLYSR